VDKLILRALQGEASEIEERRLLAWRQADPANERMYQRARRIWDLGETLVEKTEQSRVPTIEEMTPLPRPRSRPVGPPSIWRRTWRRRALVPAMFLIGIAISYAIFRAPADSPLGVGEFATNGAETATLTLGDGTMVRLAPDTRLRLIRSAGREVWLDGHAYFAVDESQNGQTFRVRTKAGDAVVLGTRFDLQAREDEMRLLVVEGRVEVAARGRKVEVTANEVARVAGSAPLVHERVGADYLERELDWMRDVLVFTGTPLGQVARELTQRYGVPITISDSTLARETVRGWFADRELSDVLVVVCRAVEAQCVVDENGVTIAP
jgi:transmembrane sensor